MLYNKSTIQRGGNIYMGQAKKELAEQEAKLARKDKYLEKKGYNKCVECQEMFIPKDGEIICGDCWEKKVAD